MIRIATLAAVAVVAANPPATLFRPGYDLCRAAPLSAIRAAGGQPYRRGLYVNRTCLWERADLKAGITLSTHPVAAGQTVMQQLLARNGEGGFTTRHIAVTGARDAIVVTLPRSLSSSVAKDLLAAYGTGVVQVNMNAPRTLPDARLVAVLKVVTRMR